MGMKPRRKKLGPIEETKTALELARRMAISLCEPIEDEREAVMLRDAGWRAATAYWLRGVRALTGNRDLLPGAYCTPSGYVLPGDEQWNYKTYVKYAVHGPRPKRVSWKT